MKRNLLLIHLESLNMEIYGLHRHWFPTLKEVEKKSVFFDKYFSTATSTLMVLEDLLYGGMEQYEQGDSLAYIPEDYVYQTSLFDDLKKIGYHTGLYIYLDHPDWEIAEKKHLAGFDNQIILRCDDYKEYLQTFEKEVEQDSFAIMACSYLTNLAFNCYVYADEWKSGADNWRAGYDHLDQNVKDLLQILEKKNKLESTVVILYGDHGDDYWTHGGHKGLAHAIEPYASLIHTPLFILDSTTSDGERNERLINTIDLRTLIYQIITRETNWEREIDLKKRVYSISRNEYAAQPLRKDSFNKSYCITDGKYLLMVSNDGLCLYDIEMDFGCHNNLLRFFDLYDGMIKINSALINEYSFHFVSYMNQKQIRVLRQKFYYLCAKLYQEVKNLYVAGKRSESDMLSEMRFDIIHYRG